MARGTDFANLDYERIYPRIAGPLQRLCDRYGFGTVLGIFSGDMPRYFAPREREERHKRALRASRSGKKQGARV